MVAEPDFVLSLLEACEQVGVVITVTQARNIAAQLPHVKQTRRGWAKWSDEDVATFTRLYSVEGRPMSEILTTLNITRAQANGVITRLRLHRPPR